MRAPATDSVSSRVACERLEGGRVPQIGWNTIEDGDDPLARCCAARHGVLREQLRLSPATISRACARGARMAQRASRRSYARGAPSACSSIPRRARRPAWSSCAHFCARPRSDRHPGGRSSRWRVRAARRRLVRERAGAARESARSRARMGARGLSAHARRRSRRRHGARRQRRDRARHPRRGAGANSGWRRRSQRRHDRAPARRGRDVRRCSARARSRSRSGSPAPRRRFPGSSSSPPMCASARSSRADGRARSRARCSMSSSSSTRSRSAACSSPPCTARDSSPARISFSWKMSPSCRCIRSSRPAASRRVNDLRELADRGIAAAVIGMALYTGRARRARGGRGVCDMNQEQRT